MEENPHVLPADRLQTLQQQLRTNTSTPVIAGYSLFAQPIREGALTAQIPPGLIEASVSVCGNKQKLFEQHREFVRSDGSRVTLPCAYAAAMAIDDSPVHVHGSTVELYAILEGEGRMVLGKEVKKVRKGTAILLPPGVIHGLASLRKNDPVKALLTFTPGLAPPEYPEFRDEQLIATGTREYIRKLLEA